MWHLAFSDKFPTKMLACNSDGSIAGLEVPFGPNLQCWDFAFLSYGAVVRVQRASQGTQSTTLSASRAMWPYHTTPSNIYIFPILYSSCELTFNKVADPLICNSSISGCMLRGGAWFARSLSCTPPPPPSPPLLRYMCLYTVRVAYRQTLLKRALG